MTALKHLHDMLKSDSVLIRKLEHFEHLKRNDWLDNVSTTAQLNAVNLVAWPKATMNFEVLIFLKSKNPARK